MKSSVTQIYHTTPVCTTSMTYQTQPDINLPLYTSLYYCHSLSKPDRHESMTLDQFLLSQKLIKSSLIQIHQIQSDPNSPWYTSLYWQHSLLNPIWHNLPHYTSLYYYHSISKLSLTQIYHIPPLFSSTIAYQTQPDKNLQWYTCTTAIAY